MEDNKVIQLDMLDLKDLDTMMPIQTNKVTLCLNMIVKNESRIITRLLETVAPIIDTYIICDTGSTDNTIELITYFFNARGISGQVIVEPFKNFGYNRTFALKAAYGKGTYALLLDADMRLRIEPTFNKQLLKADAYNIIQKNGGMSYYNTRLIKLSIDAKCVSPTHEYYDLPNGSTNDRLDSLWIDDIGDGGCKIDKFDRDIRLLKQGIEDEPNNGRYYFYLANSYFNSNRKGESIPYYQKRIEIGGWSEEVFYAHLNLGHAFIATNQPEMAISTWMKAYEVHSTRSETIYEICKYYREKGLNKLSLVFYNLGKSIPYPKGDVLFIHDDVYQYKFDYELSIIGFYTGTTNLHKITTKLLNHIPDGLFGNVLSNYKFCSPRLSKYINYKVPFASIETMEICGVTYEMRASNPCVFKGENGQNMINVRYVNYFLENNGCYTFNVHNDKIVTANKLIMLDDNFKVKTNSSIKIFIPDNGDLRYVGVEDVKPYYHKHTNTYEFLGTCQNPRNGHISIGSGLYNIENSSLTYQPVETEWNKNCEKNWVYLKDNEIIYQWYPMIIGKIEENNQKLMFTKTQEIQTPSYLRHIRGSSHGFEYNNEIWFLCHLVEYSTPRHYYHMFVILDKDNYSIKQHSDLFTFEGEKIEYAIGLVVNDDNFVISYSKWDRDACIGVFDKQRIMSELF